MKKFMGLLLIMALLVGTASMGLAEVECVPDCFHNDDQDTLDVEFEIVHYYWIGVGTVDTLAYNPCDVCNEPDHLMTDTFDWGYAGNGCADYSVCVQLTTFETSDLCGETNPPYFKLRLDSKTPQEFRETNDSFEFTGYGSNENCEKTKDRTGDIWLIADKDTCTGEGSAVFTFTLLNDCIPDGS